MKQQPFRVVPTVAPIAIIIGLMVAVWVALSVATLPIPSAFAALPRQALNAPSNLACLPFPQPTITEYNGEKVSGPYTTDATQTTISWRDESDSETGYRIQRRESGGNWEDVATLPADTILYTDTNLTAQSTFFYRVGAQDANSTLWRESCRKPMYLDSSDGNFRVFYRPYGSNAATECPDVENLEGTPATMCSSQSTAQRMVDTLELSYAWIIDNGFPDPVPGSRFPVDLTLCDNNGCASGGTGGFLALNPGTMATPFDLASATNETALRVPRHELFHVAQQGVTAGGDRKWVIEATARSTDDKYCLDAPTCDLTLDTFPSSWYFDDAQDYLNNPNRTLFETGYEAALFWTYISEQYGKITDEPERGIDFFAQFWVSGQANAHTHGRQVIDFALDDMEYNATFEDVFKDFVVANYAKDIPNAPAKYKYIDETQTPGTYGAVFLTDDESLSVGEQYIVDEAVGYVESWGARYFRFVPQSGVATVDVKSKSTSGDILYYTLLAVKNGSIVDEINYTGALFEETVANNNLDEVVLVVAGLEEYSNFSLAVNATQPELRIQDPIVGRPAQAGDPTAPEKILVKVAVLSPEVGTPIAGIDPASFTVTIGAAVVPDNQVISTAYIQGEYWLLLRAPVQPGMGTYDLLVENDTVVAGSVLSDTEVGAVVYDSAIESDNMIVGDRSGSMDDFPGKLEAAQDAARLYVDSWETGDQLGIVSYNSTAVANPHLQAWTNTLRTNAFTVINNWVADGGTGIGNALLEALSEFDDSGDSNHPWHIFLLSDGMETVEEPNIEDFVTEYSARVSAGDQVPIVHAVALGPDADQQAMQQLAGDTGGTYEFAGEAGAFLANGGDGIALSHELAEIYRVVAETISLEQQIYAAHDTLPYGPQVQEHIIHVDGSASEAVFTVKVAPGSFNADVRLLRPDGVVVPFTRADQRHILYRVSTPMSGAWKIRVFYTPPGEPDATTLAPEAGLQYDYLVEAALRSDLTMNVFLGIPPSALLAGNAVPMYISLSDSAPLVGATVTGRVTSPSGVEYPMTYRDDGLHGDGAAGDGFYGGTFYFTSQPGSYQVVIDAEGTSPLHGAYTRRARTAFYVARGEDNDHDGLPDHWEEDHGLDPEVPDPTNSDPDGDGLFTYTEFQIGTHPLDPDTDNGGENDGSEYARGKIPQDNPADDGVRPPVGVGWGGAGQLWLTYSTLSDYDHLRVFRAVAPNGPYVLVADNVPPTLQWHDTNVDNDQEYCYRLVGVSAQGAESGSNRVTCITPQQDPLEPEGGVLIENNAPTTPSVEVDLQLRASDAPSDQHTDPAGDPPITEGATISGVAEMMISNRYDFAGATWEPYAATKAWTLEPQADTARVYVKFRDRAGNVSETVSDSIQLGLNRLYLPIVQR